MKAIIENPIQFTNAPNYYATLDEYGDLLQVILNAKDELDLVAELSTKKYDNLIYGFGSSHFWVSQKLKNKDLVKRIIFVEF